MGAIPPQEDDRFSELRERLSGLEGLSDDLKYRITDVVRSLFVDKRGVRRGDHPRFSLGEDDGESDRESIEDCQDMKATVSVGTQVDIIESNNSRPFVVRPTMERTNEELDADYNKGMPLQPGDLLRLLNRGIVKIQNLESKVGDDLTLAVAIRRSFVSPDQRDVLTDLPFTNYDYKYVKDACCENVIGYLPVPVGVVNIKVNDKKVFVPMATTEGGLIASTNRGASAITRAGGATSLVYNDGMTRAPALQFPSIVEAVKFKKWIEVPVNAQNIKAEFDKESRFARLELPIECLMNGREVHPRFKSRTGDAMGMNMVSKGVHSSLTYLENQFPNMTVITISGNTCSDKKAAAINWIEGRGRSVVAECSLPKSVVEGILKTTVPKMVEACRVKCYGGSALAGAIGGGNAHAANVVAAIFIATGQDPAQVVSSSMCSTNFVEEEDGSLYASVTMPCIEIGTKGGGTELPAQAQCLKLIGVAGASPASCEPGDNAKILAETIAATVLAGELSLMAALTTGDLVKAHLRLNRSKLNMEPVSSAPALHSSTINMSIPIKGKTSRHLKVDCSTIL